VRDTAQTATSAGEHPADILELVTTVNAVLNDRTATPPPNNSYSHETAYGPEQLAEPRVYLDGTETYSAVASTDCSGWVSFIVNTVSPLHEAVLQSQRRLAEYNQTYSDGFELKERERAWPRAFVLANYFRADHAKATGFQRIQHYEQLEFGDLAAYAMGRYTDPADTDLKKPKDTGHTFVVVGSPSVIDPNTEGYDANGTLARRADKVIAVPIIDSSSLPHFDPDSRKNAEGGFSLPARIPYPKAKAGGIGAGTAWFALDKNGRVLQRRLGPGAEYIDVVIGAARLQTVISLVPEILDEEGNLVVEIYDNSPVEYRGATYGRLPVTLTGQGGIRLVGGGRLFLTGQSDFTGGVTVDSGELVVESETALGAGDVEIRGGAVKLNRAALGDEAKLRLAKKLRDGAVHLGFTGKDVLHSLQIGDKVHRCGTWGGFESDAMFTDTRFSGRGMLELTAEPGDDCKK
jgi:autotransporter-associated beta strand protein